jgi:hypothetical protein
VIEEDMEAEQARPCSVDRMLAGNGKWLVQATTVANIGTVATLFGGAVTDDW